MVHQYVDIATALTPAADSKRTVNLFGVVVDCRAPCTTNGTDLRCEIALADESCVLPDGDLKKIFVHRFVAKPSDAIPFRQLGDIVRIHRAALISYSSFGKPAVRQGRLKFYSTLLLWKHEATGFTPYLQHCQAQGDSLARGPSPDPVDTQDKFKITALRKWTNDFFFAQYKSQRQYLRTVPEILNAPCGAIFLSKSFDLICYIHQYPRSDRDSNLVLTATDGAGSSANRILISSQEPWKTRGIPRMFSFFDFCPSWSFHPTSGSWLLVRDARVVQNGNRREIQLTVSGRTSTLIWNAHNAPDVRLARERRVARQLNPQHNLPIPRGIVRAPSPLPCTRKRRRINANSDSLYRNLKVSRYDRSCSANGVENIFLQAMNTVPNNTVEGPLPIPEDAVSKSTPRVGNHIDAALAPPAIPNDTLKCDYHLDIVPEPYGVKKNPHQGIELAPHDRIVTVHNRADQKVWRISDMVQAFRHGSGEKLFRLAVWARGIVWPKDLRHACRPICGRCENGVLMLGSNCNDCGSDRKLWQFVLRLVLEERSPGASIESWVIGKDAERLLGLQASDLRLNDSKCDVLKRKLRTLHAAISVVDCLVVPYEYEDDVGLHRVACVLKGTRLLP
ncbi:Telomeric single stranded DNA binding POT1/CDC13 [Gracilaria domingensis]|nr:Telomeric single stranded DNA binding POT1/CDC13 [Gracilaria domingensis]